MFIFNHIFIGENRNKKFEFGGRLVGRDQLLYCKAVGRPENPGGGVE